MKWLRLAALVALALLPARAGAAIAYVNSASNLDLSGTGFMTFPVTINATAGNFIVVTFRDYDVSSHIYASGITDTGGNTFARALNAPDSGNFDAAVEVWYAQVTTGNASDVITVSWGASTVKYISLLAAQYSGIATASPLDTTAGADTIPAQTTVTSSAFTTTQADELIVCGCANNVGGGTWTPSVGYTNRVSDSSTVVMLEDQIVSAIQTGVTISVTYSVGSSMTMAVATFKAATAAATTSTYRALIGVGK